MVKINEEMFKKATQNAGLKNNLNINHEMQRYIAVYDIPKIWINAVKTKSGIKTMSSFARQAILEKLMRDNLI